MNPNLRVLVIQIGSSSMASSYFESENFTEGNEYGLFKNPIDASGYLNSTKKQLVFTSHALGVSAFDVARRFKEINPHAIVVAFTSAGIAADSKPDSCLDAVLGKTMLKTHVPSNIAIAFLREDLSREQVVAMVKDPSNYNC